MSISLLPEEGDIDFKSKNLPDVLVVVEVVDDEEGVCAMRFVCCQKSFQPDC